MYHTVKSFEKMKINFEQKLLTEHLIFYNNAR